MKSQSLRLTLEPGKPFASTLERGDRIRLQRGRVWVTTTGRPDDIWLAPGEEHQVVERGITVLEAVGNRALVELRAPQPAASGSLGGIAFALAMLATAVLTTVLLIIAPAALKGSSVSRLAVAVID